MFVLLPPPFLAWEFWAQFLAYFDFPAVSNISGQNGLEYFGLYRIVFYTINVRDYTTEFLCSFASLLENLIDNVLLFIEDVVVGIGFKNWIFHRICFHLSWIVGEVFDWIHVKL